MKPVSLDNNSSPVVYKDTSDNSCFPIKITLGIITTTSGIVTLFSIISYLPHSVGYYAGPITLCSFVSFCVVCCADSSKKRNSSSSESNSISPTQAVSKNSKTHSKKNTNKLTLADPTSLPDELLLRVFDYLDLKDLANVGHVCRHWRDVSSDNTIWQKHYNHLGICPPENTLAPPESFKQGTVDSLLLEKSIRTQEPKKFTYKIPGSVEFFYYRDHHIYICYGEELAIIFPNHTISKSCEIFSESCGYFRPSENKLFCVNWNKKTIFLTYIDLNDKKIKAFTHPRTTVVKTVKFETLHYLNAWQPIFEKPFAFEIIGKEAFVGDANGDIIIWDLTKRYGLYTDEISDVLKEYVENPDEARKQHEASNLNSTFEDWVARYHYKKNRPILKGHTDSIIGLQVIDSYLFSISRDGTIIQWDLSTRQQVHSFQTHWDKHDLPFTYELLHFKIAGNTLFIALEKCIKKWDLTTGECLANIQMKETCKQFHVLGHLLFYAMPVKEVETGNFINNHGKQEAETRKERTIEIYNMQTLECIKTLTFPDFDSIDYDFQLIGSKLLVRSFRSLIYWDFMESGKEEIINIQAGNEEILKT